MTLAFVAQPVKQIDEPTCTAWTLQTGGVEKKPQTKENVASCCRMETMIHLSASDELPVSGGLKMKLAPVWISQDWACRRLQNVRYVSLFRLKVQLVVVKSPSGLLVNKIGLINKRETAQICQCCSHDPGKHNCKLLCLLNYTEQLWIDPVWLRAVCLSPSTLE